MKTTDKFFVNTHENGFREVYAAVIKIPGWETFDLFIHDDQQDCPDDTDAVITEGRTGYIVAQGVNCTATIKMAKQRVEKTSSAKVEKLIQATIKQHGLSLRYTEAK